jgi:hypothetical protein
MSDQSPAVAHDQQMLQYLRSVLDPNKKASQNVPPLVGNTITLPQNMLISQTFKVDDSALINEQVPTSRGFIMSLPMRDAYSVTRYSRVPTSAISAANAKGLEFEPDTTWLQPNTDAAWGGSTTALALVSGLSYSLGELALPYDKTNNVQISPDITNQFSRARTYSQIVRFESDTVSIGTVSLSGVVGGAVIGDTRDVSLVSDGSAPYSAFDETHLCTAAITPKESLLNVPLQKGIVMLQGPDISDRLRSPEASNDLVVNGQTLYYVMDSAQTSWTSPSTPTTEYVSQVDNGAVVPLEEAWIAPNATRLTYVSQMLTRFPGYKTNRKQVPPIDENGALSFRVCVPNCIFATVGSSGRSILGDVICYVSHVFANVDNKGSVNYIVRSEVVTSTLADTQQGNGSLANNAQDIWFTADANPFRATLPSPIKYVGSRVQVMFRLKDCPYGIVTGTNQTVTTQSLNIQLTFVHDAPQIWITAPTVNEPGYVGPAHFITYRDLSNSQRVVVRGEQNVQAVSNSSLAPYVQSLVAGMRIMSNLNVIPFLNILFNSPQTPFARMWIEEEYDFFVRERLPKIGGEMISEWSLMDKNVGFAAGGSFADVLGAVAGAGIPLLAQGIGKLFGASGGFDGAGQFNSGMQGGYDGAGQFNAGGGFGSSGEYGASGQFSGMRRMRG